MLLALLLPLLAEAATPPSMDQTRLAVCLDQASKDPQTAIVTASEWIGEASGTARAYPQQCLGVADAALERWQPAEDAFLAGRGFAGEADHALRARLAAMAGNAALADGRADAGLADLDLALADAKADADGSAAGGIQLDRARALVALRRMDEAGQALSAARSGASQDAATWLLSATFARRTDDLANAQVWIATAAKLTPQDPDVGLEAGVIAALGGHDDAARQSWQSVIAIAPDTPQAKQAQAYLDQLGVPPATAKSGG